MAEYVRACTTQRCGEYGLPVRVVARMSEFAGVRALRCAGCGGPTDAHAEQFVNVAVEREWRGMETKSLEVAFAADADVASIKRDVPSIELQRTKAGFLRPVSRNSAHNRRWKKEMRRAVDRYEQAEKAGLPAAPAAAGP